MIAACEEQGDFVCSKEMSKFGADLANRTRPILYIIVPCYNEERVLPVTCSMFCTKLKEMIAKGKVSRFSKIMYVDDGSKDKTWAVISQLASQNSCYIGIQQSRNRGHQNAVLAGLMEAKDRCDIAISIDCDGQDDVEVMETMVDEYLRGAEVVYGVRNNRDSDSFFKRFTAESFYRLLQFMGVETIFNHADYRLTSAKVLKALADYKEVNLFLRGMMPLVGFRSAIVHYKRHLRTEGESHYPFGKMVALALNGITSFSVKPLHIVLLLGVVQCLVGIISILVTIFEVGGSRTGGITVTQFALGVGLLVLSGGIQLACLGILGEYIGKLYLEVKHRPRYIISARTDDTVH